MIKRQFVDRAIRQFVHAVTWICRLPAMREKRIATWRHIGGTELFN
jgi:hypothetical protein